MNQRKNSLRLRSYDYSTAGRYFITIVTHQRKQILGTITEGKMILSQAGRIVDSCWKRIQTSEAGVGVEPYQIMPEHLHAIVTIGGKRQDVSENVEGVPANAEGVPANAEGVPANAPTRGEDPHSMISSAAGTLSVILRTFKAAATARLREQGFPTTQRIWMRSFHDHIIRDEREWFFIANYIRLNPMRRFIETEKHRWAGKSARELEEIFSCMLGLEGYALQRTVKWAVEDREEGRK